MTGVFNAYMAIILILYIAIAIIATGVAWRMTSGAWRLLAILVGATWPVSLSIAIAYQLPCVRRAFTRYAIDRK